MSYLMSPWLALLYALSESDQGPMDSPSPMISRVTPWRISPCDFPSSISVSLAQLSMLMKPGATARPVTSSSTLPRAFERSPIAATVSPLIATSAVTGAAPVPS